MIVANEHWFGVIGVDRHEVVVLRSAIGCHGGLHDRGLTVELMFESLKL